MEKKQTHLAIAATFTAEPIEQSLNFWMQELEIETKIEFAPYNQIFQQLLDPTSLFANNQQGINLVLVRLQDWQGTQNKEIDRNIEDFSNLIKDAVTRYKTPYIVIICPSSPEQQSLLHNTEEALIKQLNTIAGLYLVTNEDLENYPVEHYYDETKDRLGNIPYTSLFFTALGTAIARKIYSLKTSPHKVIVLDCDNTIWKGVVGEEGVEGIDITPEYRQLQKFMMKQKEAGMLLSLCSKNTESDVIQVFQEREDLELKLDDLVSWKVNWQPKSENLKCLATELNLGLDSFIFIDDNPVECAEVRSNIPEVLTINLPIEKDIVHFLKHIWAFDHVKVTEEDQQRTTLYQQNVQRERFQKETTGLEEFLEGLKLNIEISQIRKDQITRAAQLTQRTNQFNLTTKRYSEKEISEILIDQLEGRVVRVSDRFGDYGLVGLMLFMKELDSLKIDTFLLSCRVLGRGVEYQMLKILGEIAQEANLSTVKATYIQTKKNLPALNFLEKFGSLYQKKTDDGSEFVFPTEFIFNLSYTSSYIHSNTTTTEVVVSTQILTKTQEQKLDKNILINTIVSELSHVNSIEERIKNKVNYSNLRNLTTNYTVPATFTERQLVKIWSDILKVEPIGLDDNYFDLGGTSLKSVELIVQIEKQFSTKLPLTSLVTAPTIKQMSQLLNQTGQLSNNSCLVLLKKGDSYPPLFLIHDGNGETILYRNLALNLHPKRTVYGLQPLASSDFPLLHTRIEDMAAHYLKQIKTIQPEGPYLLGGMCAGGVISFEIALQLQQQQQEIAMLAIIDAANVGTPLKISTKTISKLESISSFFNEHKDNIKIKESIHILKLVSKKIFNFTRYNLSTSQSKLDSIKLKLFDYCLSKEITPPSFLKGLDLIKIYALAERKYVPTSQLFDGDILLFLGTKGEGLDTPFTEFFDDPLLGWSKRVNGDIKPVKVPGGHSSSLQEPNVVFMAQEIEKYLHSLIAQDIKVNDHDVSPSKRPIMHFE